MTFIALSNGNDLDIRYPRPEHCQAMDIAWSLSQTNRFFGRTIRPYSVAEHSLLVCEIAERELGCDVHGQLAALLHDAHEAFCGDMHPPGKAEIGRAWAEWEGKWEHWVHRHFAIQVCSLHWRRQVKQADLMALATERRDLLHTKTYWPVLEGIEPVTWIDLYSPERRAMGWEDWRDRWLDQYHELDFARNEGLHPVNNP